MSDKYVKTSKEELTAMADELRAIGPFAEDETFYFASEEDVPSQDTTITKLMPKYHSTTVIERDGICETWAIVDKKDYPYGVTKMRRPNYDTYRDNTNEEPEVLTYYIYGLKQFLKQGQKTNNGETVIYNDLDDYIEVLNGYYTFTPAFDIQVGTGSIVEVYDESDQLVEKFIVVIYGDLDSSGTITPSDTNILISEFSNPNGWSSKTNRINYMCKAADLNQDGIIDIEDKTLFLSVQNNTNKVNQIVGYVELETILYSFYTINKIGRLSFVEAYQEAINWFYQKVIHGQLTQADVDNYIIDTNSYVFYQENGNWYNDFPDINKVKVTADWLKMPSIDSDDINCNNLCRLGFLQEVEIINSQNVYEIGIEKFAYSPNLSIIKCSPIELKEDCFRRCRKLIVGENSLNLDNCILYEFNCLQETNLIKEISICLGAKITYGAFENSGLTTVHLPDIPPTLNASPDDVFPSTTLFYVSSQNIIDNVYSMAENWCNLVTNNRFRIEGESNGSNQ